MASRSSGEPQVRVVAEMGARSPITVVVVYGEHDHGSRGLLRDALADLDSNVIVDLSWCAFMDSSIVAVILAKHAELVRAQRWLELIVPPRNRELARTVERLGVGHLMPVRVSAPPVP
jgi:anti-anti-sigma regulatory factor